MKSQQQKLGLERPPARQLFNELESSSGSAIAPNPTKHDVVKDEHMFDMRFEDGGGGDWATTYTTKAQTRAGAMTAPRWVYSNLTNNNTNDNDGNEDDDNDAKRGTRGKSSNPIVHGNNGDNNDNDDSNDARSRAAFDDFSASFHADYHNPRTHPPKNN